MRELTKWEKTGVTIACWAAASNLAIYMMSQLGLSALTIFNGIAILLVSLTVMCFRVLQVWFEE